MKRYQMTIKVLSPVHIGTGQELDPLEYMVQDGLFRRLDLTGFLQSLPDAQKQQFYEAVNSENPVRLRKFITKSIGLEKYTLFCADASETFAEAYKRNLDNPLNQLLVNLTARTGRTHYPYLPGSSIKGALRTAVISCIAEHKNITKPDIRRFERDVLGHNDGKQDPFRCVKIADAMLPDNATFIDKVEIFKPTARSGPDPAGIQMFYEQCFSMLDGEDVEATTTMAIDNLLPDKDHFNQRNRRREPAVSMKITAEQITDYCRRFYLPKIETEHNNFYRAEKNKELANQRLLDVKFGQNEFPVRLGRFSHIECTTVDGLRRPGGAAARRGHGGTRTLSGGEMAMGWVKVSFIPAK